MGTPISPIIPKQQASLEHLRGKVLAVDAYNEFYQFLSLIRLPNGEPLRGPRGEITSHLVGLAFRITRLMLEYNMRFVFIFDGPPHPLKKATLEKRRKFREKAKEEWRRALLQGNYEKAFSKAIFAFSLDAKMVEDARKLLLLMGVPCIQAPSDAEAQAAFLTLKRDAWATSSKDFDALLYGTPRLVRYVTISGTEFLPSRGIVKPLKPEIMELDDILRHLGITRRQLIDVAILVGTDFNEGIKGIGPKTALKLIKTYGSIDRLPRTYREQLGDYEEIRSLFLNPPVTKNYDVEFRSPDVEGVEEFLFSKGFSRKRIKIIVNRLERISTAKFQSLDKWLDVEA
mgnify:CR=1 FL=1